MCTRFCVTANTLPSLRWKKNDFVTHVEMLQKIQGQKQSINFFRRTNNTIVYRAQKVKEIRRVEFKPQRPATIWTLISFFFFFEGKIEKASKRIHFRIGRTSKGIEAAWDIKYFLVLRMEILRQLPHSLTTSLREYGKKCKRWFSWRKRWSCIKYPLKKEKITRSMGNFMKDMHATISLLQWVGNRVLISRWAPHA